MTSSQGMSVSDLLHARVRALIDAACLGRPNHEDFDSLACDIARYQSRAGTGLDALLASRSISPEALKSAEQIPAFPTDLFKMRRIACHPEFMDEAIFRTSGTTIGARGEHAMRSTRTYRHAALSWARYMLFPDIDRLHLVFLAPPIEVVPDSSLGFMFACFAEGFGLSASWVVAQEQFDLPALRRVVARAHDDSCPVFIAGASFSFVHLLDQSRGDLPALPAGSRVMQTGGFKGRSREVPAEELHFQISSSFGLPSNMVVSEYGMTELSSQAYQIGIRKQLGLPCPSSDPNCYLAPPWMQIRAVSAASLAPVQDHNKGIARIIDLANVDSAVAIQTQDQVITDHGSFLMLGRDPEASARGCSIGIDEILGGT